MRSRTILRPNQGMGAACGSLSNTQVCNSAPCDVDPCIANPCRLGYDAATGMISFAYTCVPDALDPLGRLCLGMGCRVFWFF